MKHLRNSVVLLVVALVAGCSPILSSPQSPYRNLVDRFDPHFPGRGLDAYTPTIESDHAMAYALVASAESHRYRFTGENRARQSAIQAADWLVEHRDPDGDGVIGWGLPFAWDAFGDGSINPANATYTITTALAIQALLDVHRVSGDPELLGLALAAAHTMLDSAYTRTPYEAWFHYSPAESDAFPVFNISAMMVGQLQRLASVETDLAIEADLVATHLLNAGREDAAGRIYWPYSAPGAPGDDRENDLVHAAYIVQGLADYARYGGNLDVDVGSLYTSLTAFLMEDGGISEMPHETRPARDWGVGAALFTTALIEQEFGAMGELSQNFYTAALSYDPPVERFYPRQAAHVLLGLSRAFP